MLNEASLPLEIELEACPICNGSLADWAAVSGYSIQRCRSCGYALVNPRPTLDVLSEYYASRGHTEKTSSSLEQVLEQERRYPNSTKDARRIVSEVARLGPGRKFLDVGCGYGFFSREARRRGFQVHAVEVSKFERRCAQELAGVVPEATTFEEFESEASSYDAILMSQILEHVLDIRLWIAKSHRLLTPGGVLAIAVPNFDSFLRLLLGRADPMVHPPDHLNYFDAKALAGLLQSEGFQVQRVLSISRVPGSALTRRLPPLPTRLERLLEWLVQAIQRPILWPIDRLGLGMFLNVFATKEETP